MATRKPAGQDRATRKPAPGSTAAPRVPRQAVAAATTAGDTNRLLREAAWSQMFGRVEAKNPFAR